MKQLEKIFSIYYNQVGIVQKNYIFYGTLYKFIKISTRKQYL